MEKTHLTLSRRDFLLFSGIALLNHGACAPAVKAIVIPALTEIALEDIYTWAKTNFDRAFVAGETLSTSPQQAATFQGDVGQLILDKFRNANPGNAFCTPVTAIYHGTNRFLQVAQEGYFWSLVTGGAAGDQVFTIHRDWLTWLLNKDDCNLRFNGNSSFGDCGVNGCGAFVSRQSFLDVNGQDVSLEFVDEEKSGDAILAHKAQRHSKPWHGCSVQTPGDPEECVL